MKSYRENNPQTIPKVILHSRKYGIQLNAECQGLFIFKLRDFLVSFPAVKSCVVKGIIVFCGHDRC